MEAEMETEMETEAGAHLTESDFVGANTVDGNKSDMSDGYVMA